MADNDNDFKDVKVHYRYFKKEELSPNNLNRMIQSALREKDDRGHKLLDNWQYRLEENAPIDGVNRLFNFIHFDQGSTYGILCAFEQSKLQVVLGTDESGPDVPIRELSLEHGKISQGIAHWLVYDDHVYVVQDRKMTAAALESYLNWLLCNKTKVSIGKIVLAAKIPVDSLENLGEIKGVRIGGIVSDETEQDSHEPFTAKLRRLFNELMGAQRASEIFNKKPTESDIKLSLYLGLKGSQSDNHTLNEIAIELRNLEDGNLQIETENGNSNGDDIRLSRVITVRLNNENVNLLDLDDLRRKILEFHADNVSKGLV
ncbi:MAG: hypothetical protein OXG15_01205 [Gammaproteobacteria bacterium]|nr:hypothetical protein [Gammaproteobacteria bacterium]